MSVPHPHLGPTTVIHADGGLRLMLPVEDDVPDIVAACRDAEIQRFTRVPSPYEDADAMSFIIGGREAAEDRSALGLVVRAAGGRLLGSCGLVSIDWRDGRATLGYGVDAPSRLDIDVWGLLPGELR